LKKVIGAPVQSSPDLRGPGEDPELIEGFRLNIPLASDRWKKGTSFSGPDFPGGMFHGWRGTRLWQPRWRPFRQIP